MKNNTVRLRLDQLKKEREAVFSLPADQAVDRILASKEPVALVHSIPSQDFHMLIHEIGYDVALPLIKLASYKQWEYFLDVEGWDRDRIDLNAVTRWAHLFLSADGERMSRWVSRDKVEFFEYYLFKNIRVFIKEHDQDPSDFGNEFFTLDGTFYIRIVDRVPPEKAPGELIETSDQNHAKEIFDQTRRRFITDTLKRLADEDPVRFHQILIEAMHVIPSEVEEEAFRRRNVRLAEKGFVPFDEAIGVYQPLSLEDIKRRAASKKEHRPVVGDSQAVGVVVRRVSQENDPVIRALASFESDRLRRTVEFELANLANRIIVADQKQISERTDLEHAVQKTCGYINIGISALLAEPGADGPDPEQSSGMMANYSLSNLFRLGFGTMLRLKWHCDRWYRQSWVREQKLPLTFFGESWLGVLGGLLLKKPLYFDDSLAGRRYREFASKTDVGHTEATLKEIIAMDRLLGRMGMDLTKKSPIDGYLTYKNLLLTLWARDHLNMSPEMEPIALSRFKPFYSQFLMSPQGAKPTGGAIAGGKAVPGRTIRLEAKQSFLDWLIKRSDLSASKIRSEIGSSLEALFIGMESELGNVSVEDLDARYITLFLLRR